MAIGDDRLRQQGHEVDVAVVGGGMGGICAAVAAARHGARVVLMQDRPVLGGNASSECRVHVCGADRHNNIPHMRETGILEEMRMENLYRNPQRSFSIWDTVLYQTVKAEANITLLLNCSCIDATMADDAIQSVAGWQLTTQTLHTVKARTYIDCSGDGSLAPLTGAQFRMGREARHEYDESIAPEEADARTMGMSCLFQSREYDSPQPFEPPSWARRFDSCEELPYGANGHRWWEMGYWWVELGGEHHSIHDTEVLRDELMKIVYGLWDHIKNRCPNREAAANWALEWVQFLPAKRESRRYVGEHVLTQNDIEAEGRFDDLVAYGGWTMDDHHPAGFRAASMGEPATIFHKAPSPFGIPYRALYSTNVDNLLFAGRDASCTHAAMSSTRVMGTCCSMGQAAGTAAAMAIQRNVPPRGMDAFMEELQQALLVDDCYLPWISMKHSPLTVESKLSASQGDPEPVRDGIHRQVGEDAHAWTAHRGDSVTYMFPNPKHVERATLILDSAMDKLTAMSYHQRDDQLCTIPEATPKAFHLEALNAGQWESVYRETNNYQRLVPIDVNQSCEGIRFTLEETWGAEASRIYGFYLT